MNDTSGPHLHHQYPWREGNKFEILADGLKILPDMLTAINSSQHFILLEMYLIESGFVVNQFANALRNAANRGVKVFMLLDDYGAIGLKKRERDLLDIANIEIVYYNKLRSPNTLYNLYRIFLRGKAHSLYRDHRKLLFVDGTIAYVGGIALIDEVDPPAQPDKRWRETVIKIQGPVLNDWQQLFKENWEKTSKQRLTLPPSFCRPFQDAQLGKLSFNDAKRHSELLDSLIDHISRAKQRVWFATAYFFPSWRIRRALKKAAKSGVDVRLLLPGPVTDHPAVRYASHRFYSRLLKNGVRIFEYQPRFFHAKSVMCDDWVTIGSCNFDRWNLRWNLEANQEIQDYFFAEQMKEMFESDFKNCLEYSYESWQQRSWRLRVLQWFWKQIEIFSHKIGH